MKLKNKKTGKVIKLDIHWIDGKNYESLAEIDAEWEDYEEPKVWWYIDCNGEVFRSENASKEHTDEHKSIGNYYTSSEEAKKAVEKLKAWKRLKDNGFRFVDHTDFDDGNITIWGKFNKELDARDVNLLFGGEE